eukprot:7309184-Pyramimonas_sp.AAC.1
MARSAPRVLARLRENLGTHAGRPGRPQRSHRGNPAPHLQARSGGAPPPGRAGSQLPADLE